MLYREAGQYKTSYAADQAIFPIPQDRWALIATLVVAFAVLPLVGSQYWLGPILTQFLVFALATLGLNILTGYAGQLSLGTGAFMAVGAFATYNLAIRLPALPLPVDLLLAGLITAAVGVVFGLPSLRIKGLYLAVTTLAAQFFIIWVLEHVGWLSNYNPAGVISAPPMTLFGVVVSGPEATPAVKYLLALSVVAVMALVAKNLVRSATGRSWMAIRDMDIAAEIIGIRPLRTKLIAFAVSSFYIGVAGGLYAFTYLGQVDTAAFGVEFSFLVLFMVIIGGLGSVLGSFLGAAFIVLLPVALNTASATFAGGTLAGDTMANLELIVFGATIVFFLVVEPHGFARLWQIGKEKLRQWPFPY
jgi:branched-chain amino acid transport system permease protein